MNNLLSLLNLKKKNFYKNILSNMLIIQKLFIVNIII